MVLLNAFFQLGLVDLSFPVSTHSKTCGLIKLIMKKWAQVLSIESAFDILNNIIIIFFVYES
jgi:hypothetical protein